MKAATEDLLKKEIAKVVKDSQSVGSNGLTDENCHAKEYPAD